MNEARLTQEFFDLSARIAAIEAQTAIADLIYRHAELVRSGLLHEATGLFTDDAAFEILHFDPDRPGETILRHRIEGASAITGSKDDIAGQSAKLWPMIHNLRIGLDGDRASSTCVSMAAIWPHGTDTIGEYRDTFRKEDGVWRFASRAFVVFGRSDGAFATQAFEEYEAAKR